MPMITVRLRFVGLYLNAPVTLDPDAYPGGITVKNVMDKYIETHPIDQPGGLSYSVKEDHAQVGSYSSLHSVTHRYIGKFDWDGNGVIQEAPAGPDGPTLIGEIRPPGLYKLAEFAIPGATRGVVAWQYYVQGADGVLKSATPRNRSITRFDNAPPDYTIENNDTILWRMVAILLEPSLIGKQPRELAKSTPGVFEDKAKPYLTA